MDKFKLFSVRIKLVGILEQLLLYKGICEDASPLGAVQEVDIPTLVKFQLAKGELELETHGLSPL